jgi:hypothetical protein
MKRIPYEDAQVTELLHQALETELGGADGYLARAR